MNIFKELLAKLHIAREHMTSEYRLYDLVVTSVAYFVHVRYRNKGAC